MTRRVPLITQWLPVALWMALIFFASTDLFSSQRTSRIIGPLLRWFNPNISDQAIRHVQFVIRKGGHFVEYAVLSMLIWRAVNSSLHRTSSGWNWRYAAWAFGISALYALTDELHQSLVPSRFSSPYDILLDSTGAAFGLALVWCWHRTRARLSASESAQLHSSGK